jgi:hypothetical protein
VAKKSRTPPPPRKVQAPKQRKDARQPLFDRKRLYTLLGVTALGAVGVGIGLAFAFTKGGGISTKEAVAAIRQAGCRITLTPAAPSRQHVAGKKITYTTYPAVSGSHNPSPAIWGDYTQPTDVRYVVHNEEHGAVVIWYGSQITTATRQQLTDFYNESPNGVIVTPLVENDPDVKYPKHDPLGSRIALTAWISPRSAPDHGQNVIAFCPGFRKAAFEEFRKAFRGRGPERFPISSNRPGT